MAKACKKVAEFTNHRGETKTIHKDHRGRLAVARDRMTIARHLTAVVGPLVGERIRQARKAAGLTTEEMVRKAGFCYACPKEYGWAIENPGKSGRGAIRFGSLYALAMVLGVEVVDLMPSVQEVRNASGVVARKREELVLGSEDSQGRRP